MKASKTLYLCGVDWQHEIGHASDLEGKMPLYSSLKRLKAERKCWKECGIVALEVTEKTWPAPQRLFPRQRKKGAS